MGSVTTGIGVGSPLPQPADRRRKAPQFTLDSAANSVAVPRLRVFGDEKVLRKHAGSFGDPRKQPILSETVVVPSESVIVQQDGKWWRSIGSLAEEGVVGCDTVGDEKQNREPAGAMIVRKARLPVKNLQESALIGGGIEPGGWLALAKLKVRFFPRIEEVAAAHRHARARPISGESVDRVLELCRQRFTRDAVIDVDKAVGTVARTKQLYGLTVKSRAGVVDDPRPQELPGWEPAARSVFEQPTGHPFS